MTEDFDDDIERIFEDFNTHNDRILVNFKDDIRRLFREHSAVPATSTIALGELPHLCMFQSEDLVTRIHSSGACLRTYLIL